MSDIYYSPEKFGLETVGEIEFSSGSYEFDLLVVWRDRDGSYLAARDHGCSCPSPFEGHHLGEGGSMERLADGHAVMAHLQAAVADAFQPSEDYYYGATRESVDAAVLAIGQRVLS